jgi:hypothetical protein
MYYHIVAKCCNNNFLLIGNNNAETHYEATIPSAQEQPYDTIKQERSELYNIIFHAQWRNYIKLFVMLSGGIM